MPSAGLVVQTRPPGSFPNFPRVNWTLRAQKQRSGWVARVMSANMVAPLEALQKDLGRIVKKQRAARAARDEVAAALPLGLPMTFCTGEICMLRCGQSLRVHARVHAAFRGLLHLSWRAA